MFSSITKHFSNSTRLPFDQITLIICRIDCSTRDEVVEYSLATLGYNSFVISVKISISLHERFIAETK